MADILAAEMRVLSKVEAADLAIQKQRDADQKKIEKRDIDEDLRYWTSEQTRMIIQQVPEDPVAKKLWREEYQKSTSHKRYYRQKQRDFR